jgi:hypothetical protein
MSRPRAASPEAAPNRPLHRDIDCNTDTGIPPVVHVVAVVDIVDIHFVVVIPAISPVRRPWIYRTEPITLVLEAWISAYNQERLAVNTESMIRSEIYAEAVVRDAIAVVAATLLPGAVIGFPVL